MTQERISDLEDKLIEIIQSEERREKNIGGKLNKTTGTSGAVTNGLTFWIWRKEKGKVE